MIAANDMAHVFLVSHRELNVQYRTHVNGDATALTRQMQHCPPFLLLFRPMARQTDELGGFGCMTYASI